MVVGDTAALATVLPTPTLAPPTTAVTRVVNPVAAVADTAPPGTTLPAASFHWYLNEPAPLVEVSV